MKISDFLIENIESISEEVHNAWWREKEKKGFHPPIMCTSPKANFLHDTVNDMGVPFPPRRKCCDLCHPDMYLYSELPDEIKEYDRATVRSVAAAIEKLEEPNE